MNRTISRISKGMFLVFSLFWGSSWAVTSDIYQLIGPDGKVTASLATSLDGTPALFFFDKQGKNRMNLSLYPEGTPGIVLNDSSERAVAILRMHGTHESPVLVFKANGGDRMVLGLRDDGSFTPYVEPMPDGSGAAQKETSTSQFPALVLAAIVGFFGGILGGRIFK